MYHHRYVCLIFGIGFAVERVIMQTAVQTGYTLYRLASNGALQEVESGEKPERSGP